MCPAKTSGECLASSRPPPLCLRLVGNDQVYDLVSNWAYMVIAALAWNLKAWFALLQVRAQDATTLLAMEFRTFINYVILVPAQVIRKARQVVVRIIGYTPGARMIFSPLRRIGRHVRL